MLCFYAYTYDGTMLLYPSHQQMIREELFVLLLLLLSCIVLRRHMGGCEGMNMRSTVLLSPIGVVRWVDGIA